MVDAKLFEPVVFRCRSKPMNVVGTSLHGNDPTTQCRGQQRICADVRSHIEKRVAALEELEHNGISVSPGKLALFRDGPGNGVIQLGVENKSDIKVFLNFDISEHATHDGGVACRGLLALNGSTAPF